VNARGIWKGLAGVYGWREDKAGSTEKREEETVLRREFAELGRSRERKGVLRGNES
jgi:hypothetical protein